MINLDNFYDQLKEDGFENNHYKLKSIMNDCNKLNIKSNKFTYSQIQYLLNINPYLKFFIEGKYKIPNFKYFCDKLKEFYNESNKIKEGKVSNYIPELANVDPEL